MSEKIVLDTSALIALIQDVQEAEIVKPLLKHAAMSTVNVTEALIALQHLSILPQEAVLHITDIIEMIVPFDLKQAQRVAELQKNLQDKGLTLGDLACIALGIILKAPIYTAKAWGELNLENTDIRLIG